MTLTVRLDAELEDLLDVAARKSGQTKSEIVRHGVRSYCETLVAGNELSLYDVMAGEIGLASGGPPDLATNANRYLAEGFAAEHRDLREGGEQLEPLARVAERSSSFGDKARRRRR